MRFADVDLNEDEDMAAPEGDSADSSDDEEEEEGEGEDDDFIDLLDILDGKGEVDNGSDTENFQKPTIKATERPDTRVGADDDQQDDDMVDNESYEESDNGDENFRLSSLGSEDEAPEALDDLQNFISTLDPSAKKRKAPADDEATQNLDRSRKQRRVTIKERTEAGAENEFRAQTSGAFVFHPHF